MQKMVFHLTISSVLVELSTAFLWPCSFGEGDLSIEVKEDTLLVRGEKKSDDKARKYIHQGSAARNFERRFRLAEYVEVSAASLENGFCTSI